MAMCAFVGDEVSAAGFRLAGIEVHVPLPTETTDLFCRLCTEVELLLMTAEFARELPNGVLDRELAAEHPLILVIPDCRGCVEPVDIAARVRRQLGMAQ